MNWSLKKGIRLLGCYLLTALIVSCGTPTPQPDQISEEATAVPLPTAPNVPPTFTPSGAEAPGIPTPLPSQLPQPTPIPETPIPFDDVVITARLQIPAVGYDRRLEGNIGSELIFIDEAAARGQHRVQQALILIELQQALKDLILAPVPDDCSGCVRLLVTFPLEGSEVSGWLQDPVLFASLENLFAIALGPHFSPNAQAGLRRTASPYAPAQTIEVAADGTVWIWQANQDQILATFAAEDRLLTAVFQTANISFQTQYAVACDGIPLESLMLRNDQGGRQLISIACPAFSLPLALLDLYVQFDTFMNETVLDALPIPKTGLPLTAVVQYQREDGVLLLIDQSANLTLESEMTGIITDTLAVSQVIELITPLFESGTVSLGLTTFNIENEAEKTAVLFVRGPQGVYDAAWAGGKDVPELAVLNALVDGYLIPSEATMESSTPSPTVEETTPTPAAETNSTPTNLPPTDTPTP